MKPIKRRALALTQEAARHWFRQSLPPHVFAPLPEADGAAPGNAQAARAWHLTGGDWKSFLSAYCACFAAVTVFFG